MVDCKILVIKKEGTCQLLKVNVCPHAILREVFSTGPCVEDFECG